MAEPMTEQQMLLEQYKLYVEMADRVSSRRAQTNKFYISLLSGILAILVIVTEKGDPSELLHRSIFAALSLLGIALNVVWIINIRSYRQLNRGKFQVIHELEQKLPFACYDREWQLLGHGQENQETAEEGPKYYQLTRIETYVPLLFILPYLLLLIYSIFAKL